MHPVVKREVLSPNVTRLEIEASRIAQVRRPGQFVIVRATKDGERIPLTIADSDARAGTITLVVQEVGKTTEMMGLLDVGDEIHDLAGPLGKATAIPEGKTVVCVGGGIGNAVVWPQVQTLKAANNKVIAILGARTKELLILEEELYDDDFVTHCTVGFDDLARLEAYGKLDQMLAST